MKIKRPRIPGSLQAWTLTLAILIVVLVLAVSDYLTLRASLAAIEGATSEETQRAAERLASLLERRGGSVKGPAFKADQKRLMEYEPQIRRVDVYLLDEGAGPGAEDELKLVQSSSALGDRALEGVEIEALYGDRSVSANVQEGGHRQVLSAHPVHFSDGRRGLVSVLSSLSAADKIWEYHARIRSVAVLGSAILLTGSVVILFRFTFYRHLRHLTTVMARFRRGHVASRASERLPGEIGQLARDFNVMLAEIQTFHDSLAEKVTVATRELAEKNRELNALNLQLFEVQRRLAQAERLALAGQLTATFAHEVGSPLSAVSTHLQILLENADLPGRVRDRLRTTAEQVDRIGSIVQNLLDTTRETPVQQRVDLAEVTTRVARLLQPAMEARGVRFSPLEATRQGLVRGNPDQLQQVFLNLFNNALEAMPHGGELRLGLSAETPLDLGLVTMTVSDTGEGIPPENLESIFEPFLTTKRTGKSFGLGLAISREIVRRHGGDLTAANIPGGGACFTLSVPAWSDPPATGVFMQANGKERERTHET